jgi:hypothetical protein
MLGYESPDWIKTKLFIEYSGLLEELSNCTFIFISGIEVRETEGYPLCYVSLDVEVFDEILFRKIKLKYPALYQKFFSLPEEKPYEIPYNSSDFEVWKLLGEYL